MARLKTRSFDLEVSRAYLTSTVREMVRWTARSAYSTPFSEGLDFTCAIFDSDGRMVVQAEGSPIHAGTLVDGMHAVLGAYEDFFPGDVIIHNDPFNGGSHQADALVVRPLYHRGELIGFGANKGHWIDIGGAAAGGWDGSIRHAVQEGLVIPPTKLYEADRLRKEIRDFILANVRLPKYVWGDLQAQIAASVVAEKRLQDLGERKGTAHIREAMADAIGYAKRHFAVHLASAPHGEGRADDVIEDDGEGGGPHRISAQVRVSAEGVVVDFEGTAPQVMSPVNCVAPCARAAAYAAVIAFVDPGLPYLSSGCLELIDVRLPEGCLLNPRWPAPIFGSTADPPNRAAETVLRAAGDICAERIAAGSYGTGNNTVGFGVDSLGKEFLWYFFESGGCGARASRDGNSGEWHLLANCRNESMEIWESRYPGRFESYSLVQDSGGPGRTRGGLGTERRFRLLADAEVSALADRHEVPPWGLAGGSAGACNAFRVIRDGRTYRPRELGATSDSKFGGVRLRAGDVYVVRQGGGGGFGSAAERPLEDIDRDLMLGFVSRDAAEAEYGVVVTVASGAPRVDVDATHRRRATEERKVS